MFEEVKKRLQGLSIKELMALSVTLDLPFSTLSNLRYGKVKNPSVNLIQKLHDHYEAKDNEANS